MKAKKTIIPSKENEKGQSLVELSISIVIILILLAGVIDLGRLFFAYIAMRDASEEGVFYGIIGYDDDAIVAQSDPQTAYCNEIRGRARQVLTDPIGINIDVYINGKECNTEATDADICTGKQIVVTITDPSFDLSMPLIGTFLGSQSIPLEAEVSGTILSPLCAGP